MAEYMFQARLLATISVGGRSRANAEAKLREALREAILNIDPEGPTRLFMGASRLDVVEIISTNVTNIASSSEWRRRPD
jgi:hypothetical protein